MIEVTSFRKAYRKLEAVAGVHFQVGAGEILGLIGPNGAGKTTTLRALAGIIPPSGGELRVAGYDVVRQPLEAKRQLAYVPDDPTLFEALTVWEHLEFTASAYRLRAFAPRAAALLQRLELESKRDAVAQELSRGMRQKVSVACALLRCPRAILFDEPLTGLDPQGIRTLKECIREQASEGVAVIVSSHLLDLVEDLCTHLLILQRGEAKFFGGVDRAREMLADTSPHASLEEIFFQVTRETGLAEQPTG